MQRSASVELRRRVDRAVGSDYDAVFLRLDLLLTGPSGRCRCDGCRELFDRRVDDLLALLPPVD